MYRVCKTISTSFSYTAHIYSLNLGCVGVTWHCHVISCSHSLVTKRAYLRIFFFTSLCYLYFPLEIQNAADGRTAKIFTMEVQPLVTTVLFNYKTVAEEQLHIHKVPWFHSVCHETPTLSHILCSAYIETNSIKGYTYSSTKVCS